MANKKNILYLLPWLLLLITINSHGQTLQLGNTIFWWLIQFFVLYLFWIIKIKFSSQLHKRELKILDYYLLYIYVSFFWGATISITYWDWKSLISNTMCLLIPIVAYSMDSKYLFKILLNRFIYISTPLFLFFQFFIAKDEFGFYLAPFTFILLFLPILPLRWKVISVIVALYVIFSDLGARSNVVKFTIPILISFLFYFKNIFKIKILNYLRILLLILPILFFILGVMGVFNIFSPQGNNATEIIDKKRDFKGEIVYENLLSDTRTVLYVDVLVTAKKYNSWLFGRSAARGNISELYGDTDMNKRGERNGNEVAILNYFTWLGILGVFFIFLLFHKASYLAVNYSNNYFSKLVGIFVAFRWTYSWVEDINIFYINNIYLWLMIGFCFSDTFRRMSDLEMKKWILDVFQFRKKIF